MLLGSHHPPLRRVPMEALLYRRCFLRRPCRYQRIRRRAELRAPRSHPSAMARTDGRPSAMAMTDGRNFRHELKEKNPPKHASPFHRTYGVQVGPDGSWRVTAMLCPAEGPARPSSAPHQAGQLRSRAPLAPVCSKSRTAASNRQGAESSTSTCKLAPVAPDSLKRSLSS